MAKRIGELLVDARLITVEQLDYVLRVQREDGRKLGHLLIEMKLVSEPQLTQELSKQLSVPWVSLYHIEFSRSLLNLVPREIAEQYSLVPIFVRKVRGQGDTLYVAMDDPTNEAALKDVARAARMPVRPMIACPSDIRSAIRVYYLGEVEAAAPAPPPSATTLPAGPPSGSMGAARPAMASQTPERRPTLPEGQIPLPPPRAAMASNPHVVTLRAPPPEAALVTAEDAAEELDAIPEVTPESEPPPSGPVSDDSPDAAPEIEAHEVTPKRRRGGVIALTLLDGTTIKLPTPKKRPSRPDGESPAAGPAPHGAPSDQLTARDIISALRAVTHGADASEILGQQPKWEAMIAALLTLLLRKGLITDAEYADEYRNV